MTSKRKTKAKPKATSAYKKFRVFLERDLLQTAMIIVEARDEEEARAQANRLRLETPSYTHWEDEYCGSTRVRGLYERGEE